MIEVTAAIIRENDRFMICRRPAHKARGGLWEFPGGKLEKGETYEQCLARECREELNVELAVGEEYMTLVHEYPDITIKLHVYNARIASGEIKLLEHSELAWITPREIDGYSFCGADTDVLAKLKTEAGK